MQTIKFQSNDLSTATIRAGRRVAVYLPAGCDSGCPEIFATVEQAEAFLVRLGFTRAK